MRKLILVKFFLIIATLPPCIGQDNISFKTHYLDKLLFLEQRDQQCRAEYTKQQNNSCKGLINESALKKIRKCDSLNLIEYCELISRYGYYSYSDLVGGKPWVLDIQRILNFHFVPDSLFKILNIIQNSIVSGQTQIREFCHIYSNYLIKNYNYRQKTLKYIVIPLPRIDDGAKKLNMKVLPLFINYIDLNYFIVPRKYGKSASYNKDYANFCNNLICNGLARNPKSLMLFTILSIKYFQSINESLIKQGFTTLVNKEILNNSDYWLILENEQTKPLNWTNYYDQIDHSF